MTKDTTDYSKKLCCNVCGFPVAMERKPVLITNNILSLLHYQDNTCESCGHQKDGSTIPVVYDMWQEMCRQFIKERDDLLKFIKYYHYLTQTERTNVCVELPRFMNPNHKATEDIDDGDVMEPYSWNVVFNEVIHNTRLSKVMVRDIIWQEHNK